MSSFTLLAQSNNEQGLLYPQIQIWRNDRSTGFTNVYNRVYTIGSINSEVTAINSTLYRYTPTNSPITVWSGDVLGLLVPPSPAAIILPYFVNNGSAPIYYESLFSETSPITLFSSYFRTRYSPLVAIDIGKSA